MGTVINNIDLYFKEYFKESKVEILKPFFLEDKMNINIKDYIEVNSAIALALQGLGLGIKNLNFMKRDWKTELKTLLSSDVNMKDIKMPKFNFKLKNKKKNLQLIQESLQEFVDNKIAIESFELKNGVFVIHFLQLMLFDTLI